MHCVCVFGCARYAFFYFECSRVHSQSPLAKNFLEDLSFGSVCLFLGLSLLFFFLKCIFVLWFCGEQAEESLLLRCSILKIARAHTHTLTYSYNSFCSLSSTYSLSFVYFEMLQCSVFFLGFFLVVYLFICLFSFCLWHFREMIFIFTPFFLYSHLSYCCGEEKPYIYLAAASAKPQVIRSFRIRYQHLKIVFTIVDSKKKRPNG